MVSAGPVQVDNVLPLSLPTTAPLLQHKFSQPILELKFFHTAIKAELHRFHQKALAIDRGTEEQLCELLQGHSFLKKFYRYHTSGEDAVILPALDLRVKNVANTYSLEHKVEGDLFEQVSDLLAAALKANGSARAALIGKLICCSEALQNCLVQHLSKEEEQVLPLLLKHFSPEEQAMLMWQFLCYLPLNLLEECLPWMASFLTEDELEEMVFHMHIIVPGEELRQQMFSSWFMKGEASLQVVISKWKELVRQDGSGSSGVETGSSGKYSGTAMAASSSQKLDARHEGEEEGSHIEQENDMEGQEMEVDQGDESLRRFPINELYHWHNAIRKELEVFAEEARQMLSSGVLKAEALASFADRYRFLADVCFFHSTAEDKVVFPALDKKAKVSSLYYHQHAEEERQFVDVGRLLEGAQHSAGNGSKTALELFAELSAQAEVIAATVQRHLLDEEIQVIPLVRQHCSVAEQRVLVYQSLREMPLRLLERVLPWVVACVNDQEAKDMIHNMKRAAPEVDFPLVTLLAGWAQKRPLQSLGGEVLTPNNPSKTVSHLQSPGDAETQTTGCHSTESRPGIELKNLDFDLGGEKKADCLLVGSVRSQGIEAQEGMEEGGGKEEGGKVKLAMGVNQEQDEDAYVAVRDRPAKRLRESSLSPRTAALSNSLRGTSVSFRLDGGNCSQDSILNLRLSTGLQLPSNLIPSIRSGSSILGSAWANSRPPGSTRKPIDTIFQFHEALRADLEFLVTESAKLGEGSDETVKQFSGHFQFLWGLYRAHSKAEDENVFPALEAKEALHNVSHSYTLDHKQEEMFFEEIAQVLGELEDLGRVSGRADLSISAAGLTATAADTPQTSGTERCPNAQDSGEDSKPEVTVIVDTNAESGDAHLETVVPQKAELKDDLKLDKARGRDEVSIGAGGTFTSEEDLKERRKGLGQRLHRMCTSVRVSLDQHVSREEVELWPLFEVHFTEEEQDQIVGRIIGTTGAEVLQAMLPWITKALTEEEQSRMMSTWRQATRNTMFDQWLSAWWKKDSGFLSSSQESLNPNKSSPALDAEPDAVESLQMVVDYFQGGGAQEGPEQELGKQDSGSPGSHVCRRTLCRIGESQNVENGQSEDGVDGVLERSSEGEGGGTIAASGRKEDSCAMDDVARHSEEGRLGGGINGAQGNRESVVEGKEGLQSLSKVNSTGESTFASYHDHQGAPSCTGDTCDGGARKGGATGEGCSGGSVAVHRGGSAGGHKGQKEAGSEDKKFKPGWQDIFRMNQQELEQAVRKVSSDKSLDPRRKAYLIQNLMTSRWIVAQQKKPGGEGDGGEVGEAGVAGRCPSFQDEARGVFGCEHYKRNCKLKAICCGQLVTCRFCHDKVSDHSMNRQATMEMMCMQCLEVQPVGPTCATPACNSFSMARYFCSICKLFDNDERPIYHCPFCNLCRVGRGLGVDYFHCMTCNACMSMDLSVHTCREKGLESNCPICHDFLFTSNTPVKALPCGHFMHSACFQAYTCGHYTCPICTKSLGDMGVYFGMLDALLASEVLPEEYRNRQQDILCNDCGRKGSAPFHWLYHKCKTCGSYNTRGI